MILLINCDMGESYGRFRIGNDAAVLPYVHLVNLACGYHGGDPLTIERTIDAALRLDKKIGAHPSYPDLSGFGRRPMQLPADELYALIKYQAAALAGLLAARGERLHHLKPHGALYHAAAADPDVAAAAARATADLGIPALLGPPDSCLERAAAGAGLIFLPEAFIDRAYQADGRSLVPRSEEGAQLHGAAAVRRRIRELAAGQVTDRHGNTHELRAGTCCIHGDHAGAEETARVAWKEIKNME